MEAYHITPIENLERILSDGLIPLIGERSKRIKELVARIYLFSTLDDVYDALNNWLGDALIEDGYEKFVLLKVLVDGRKCFNTTDWELVCYEAILPENITLINKDI